MKVREIEGVLIAAANELRAYIDGVNKQIVRNHTSLEDDPELMDYQTCGELIEISKLYNMDYLEK